MYTAWIKIDETLPWIELKGKYQTRKDAKKAAEEALGSIRIKVVRLPETKEHLKAFATVRA
jgi:hypothetical protein